MLCRALRLQDAEAEYRAAKALYERTLHPARPSADAAACYDVNADRCASGTAMADDEWLAALPEREAQPEDDEMQPSSPGGTDVRDSREKGAKLRGLVGKFWVGWGAPLGAATAAATAAADAGKSGERLVQERRRSKLHSWLHRTSATAGDGGGTGEGGGCTGGEGCGARWAAVFSKEQWAEAILQQAMLSGSQAHALVCICVRVQANATCARSARGSSLWHLRLAYASVRALHHAPWVMHGGRLRLAAAQVVQRLSMLLFDIGGLEVLSFELSRAPDLQSAGAIPSVATAQASAGAGAEAARKLWTEGRALARSSVRLHQLLMGEVRML